MTHYEDLPATYKDVTRVQTALGEKVDYAKDHLKSWMTTYQDSLMSWVRDIRKTQNADHATLKRVETKLDILLAEQGYAPDGYTESGEVIYLKRKVKS